VKLSARQVTVFRALVATYVGEASPVGSATLARTLSVPLSSATIRNIMVELMEYGLIEQPHPSAGRMPTERGLRLFVDELLAPQVIDHYERRSVARELEDIDNEDSFRAASQLLSEHTRQLGFVVRPRLERAVLRHVSLVRLSSERLLVVLVSQSGVTYRRVVEDDGQHDQAGLDRIAASLNERLSGRTLLQLRSLLEREARDTRQRARTLLTRALEVAGRVLECEAFSEGELVIATRLALLDHPEFHNPERLRQLLETLDTGETLLALLDGMLERPGVGVAFGGELDEPGLANCAVVAAPYGDEASPQGLVGVFGPIRMNYSRVIPVVDYFSQIVSHKLNA